MKAKVRDIYLMTKRKAKAKQLSAGGAGFFTGLIILEVQYEHNSGVQSIALKNSKTAQLMKKGAEVEVELKGSYIDRVKFNGRWLKGCWI